MKICKLQLKHIGVFDDETINFQECPAKDKAEIHILTGENGTGKTTILQALASFFDSHSTIRDKPGMAILRDHLVLITKRNNFNKKLNPSSLFSFDIEDAEEKETFDFRYKEEFQFVSNITKSNLSKYIDNYYQVSSDPSAYEIITDFVAFAYSGYRRILDKPIEIGNEIEENPVYQALDFIKDENSKFTINQWLGENLLDNSIAKGRNKFEDAKLIDDKINRLENVINDIIADEINDIIADEIKDNEIRFEMQSARKLVLIKNEKELDFDVLPDGLKSLISWIGDLLMRLDSLKWENDTPIFDREIILFLDEIEVHLHPAWQRKVLPIVQKLFKNAQIFVSTHSPFVVNSVDDAWVYKLKVKDGEAKVESVTKSEDGYSYETVLRETFDIDKRFGGETQEKLERFLKNSRSIITQNGNSEINKETFLEDARDLAIESAELQSVVFLELAKLSKKTGENYEI